MPLFNLETPNQVNLTDLTRFSGWYIPQNSQEIQLNLYLNEKPYASLSYGSHRPDVAAVYSEKEAAISSGFFGYLLLPDMIKSGETVDIEIFDEGHEKISLLKKKLQYWMRGELFLIDIKYST